MEKLNLFVSSTCYDLSQLRADLNENIIAWGHNPVMSEFSQFPINPGNSTLENCIDAISRRADIFVLIIGVRYGSIVESGKSITNLEYLAAVQKGVPVYVFMDKKIINCLPLYQANRSGDFSSVVDNTKLFDFAEQIWAKDKVWTFPFENAREILETIKIQLSYLFRESLILRNSVVARADAGFHKLISAKANKILLEKTWGWEFFFLSQVLTDEVEKLEGLANDVEYKIVVKVKTNIATDNDFLEWCMQQSDTIMIYIATLQNIVTTLIPKYLGENGTPSDLKGLYYSANAYARAYESLIQWTLDILSASVNHKQEKLKFLLSQMSGSILPAVKKFPDRLQERMELAAARKISGEPQDSGMLMLTLTMPPNLVKEFTQELIEYRKAILG